MTLCQYTPETVEKAFHLRQEGQTWKQIADELGGTGQSWRMLVQRRLGRQPQSVINDSIYRSGRVARLRNLKKEACPFSTMTQAGSWWLAGWNDKDIEIKGKQYETDI